MYNMYKDVINSKIWNDMRGKHNKTISLWLELYNIKVLSNEHKMIKNKY